MDKINIIILTIKELSTTGIDRYIQTLKPKMLESN